MKVGKFLSLVLICILSSYHIYAQKDVVLIDGKTMATKYLIKIADNISAKKQDEISYKIQALLADFNMKVSGYINDSEINKLNKLQNDDWIHLSKELFVVLNCAKKISVLSQGSFDITAGRLVNLWGFGTEKKDYKIPSFDLIQAVLKNTGHNYYDLNEDIKAIKKKNFNIVFDLSAIAKGYGVDLIAKLLDKENVENYLIEIGGEIKVAGFKVPREKIKWQVAIEMPGSLLKKINKKVKISDISVATSGDYRNFFIDKNKRYSHNIDPLTGYPVDHSLTSVTVFDGSCMRADAMATAIMVMGPKKGLEWSNKNDIKSYLLIKNSTGILEDMSDQMKTFMKEIE